MREFIGKTTEQLQEFKQEFSFVSLNKAFFDLAKSKRRSKNIALGVSIILSIIIILIPYFYYEFQPIFFHYQ